MVWCKDVQRSLEKLREYKGHTEGLEHTEEKAETHSGTKVIVGCSSELVI